MEKRSSMWLTNGLLITEILAMVAIFISIQCQFQAQSARTDQLYTMFVDLLKEGRK